MSKLNNCPVISKLRTPGKRVSTPLRRIGPGWSLSWNVIQRGLAKRSLPCSVNAILGAIKPPKSARSSVTSPGGERCMDPNRRGSLNSDTSQASERNRISRTWPIWVSPLRVKRSPTWCIILCSPTPIPRLPVFVSAKPICALAEGIEKALWQIGGVPEQHRTDHRSRSGASPGQVWTGRLDQALRCAHGPLRHATDLEQHRGSSREWGCRTVPLPLQRGCRSSLAHPRQSRVSQSPRLRPRISHELVRQRNLTRSVPFRAEGEVLRPLPAAPLAPCKEVRLRVSRFSTIHLDSNVYSVPSRLIGTSVVVRVRAETLEGFVGSGLAFTLPRLVGKHRHHIDYHHLIWSLVRKPVAFAAYRYRDDLFPTTTFRLAYDRLLSQKTKRADREYVRVLHLAATTSESEVEIALSLLLEAGRLPSFQAVRDLVHLPRPQAIPQLQAPTLDLSPYDQLIPSRRSHA